jgi:hypothetical protein
MWLEERLNTSVFRAFYKTRRRKPEQKKGKLLRTVSPEAALEAYTTNLADASNAILTRIFSFLETQDLCNIATTCKRWLNITSTDIIWQPHLQKYITRLPITDVKSTADFTNQFKLHYLRITKNRKAIDAYAEESVKMTTWSYRVARALLIYLPLCILLGIFYMSIVFPMFLDGVFPVRTNTILLMAIPNFFFFVIPILLTGIGVYCLTGFLIPKRIHAVQMVKGYNTKSKYLEYYYSVIFALGWFINIPLSILAIYIRIAIGNGDYIMSAMRMAFIPVHVFTVCYTIAPLFFILLRLKRARVAWFIYTIGSFINISITMQVSLISAKLDQLVNDYWVVIFLPFWIGNGVILLGMLVSPCLFFVSKFFEQEGLSQSSKGIIYCELLLAPIQLWVILFCLRLDMIITTSYVYTFIPLYASLCFVALVSCGYGTLWVFIRKILR